MLDGKVALVTGGGRGIGKAITLSLVSAGARVVITYKEDAESAVKTSRYSDRIYPPVQVDVTDSGDVVVLALRLQESVGELDVLVCNAGINRPAPFDKITIDDWNDVLDTNLTGQFKTVRSLLTLVRSGGSVVFIGSSSAFTGGPISTHYAASKAGLVGLMQNVALHAAPRFIRSNLVAPGYIVSPMADRGMENEAVRKKIEQIPLRRLGTPEDVANAVLFLASPLSSYITGTVIHVNGGLYF